jgi:hypothetical protein
MLSEIAPLPSRAFTVKVLSGRPGAPDESEAA